MQHPDLPADLLFTLLSNAPDEEQALAEMRASPALSRPLLELGEVRKLAEAMAHGPVPKYAITVIQLAHALGCRHRQSTYECVAHALSIAERWGLVLDVVALGKIHTGRTTIRLMNWRVRSLLELERHDVLQTILEEFHANQVRPNRRTFHLLISGRIRNHDLAGAKELLRTMQDGGVQADDQTHAIIARYYRAFGFNPQMQARIFESLPALNQRTATMALNSLIQLCLDAHNVAGSLQILSFYHPIAVEPITRIVSGATSIPRDGDHSLLARYPLPNPVIPNAETYSIFMNHLTSIGAHSQAFDVLNSMISADVPATGETFTSLIHLFFAAGQGSTAVKLVADICDPHEFPWKSFAPFTLDEALPLPPLTPGVQPTTRILNALMRGLMPTSGLKGVEGVIQIMHANKILPNASTVEIIIAHLAEKGCRPKQLMALLLKFCSSNLHIQPTVRHLHLILNSIIRHERFLTFGSGWDSNAAKFSRTRRPKDSEPLETLPTPPPSDPVRLEPAAGFVPLHSNDRKALHPMLENLARRNVKSDSVVLGLRMMQEAGVKVDLEGAEGAFQMLLARGHQPTEYHFAALLEGCTRAGDLTGAMELMKSAVDIGIEVNVVMFTILISGYARLGNPAQAVRTFQSMVAEGVRPDVASIDALSSAFFAVGAYAMARRTLISMWNYIEPFPEELRSVSLKQLATEFRARRPQDRKMPRRALSQPERRELGREVVKLSKAWQRFIVEQEGCTDKITNKEHYKIG
ncbi:hypothetical protein PQX77_000625 [Marasmius sp. AFHP31]|nr:hypothetical protein PQX77_000625 [Marasmius sp. AFHP31]